MILVFGGTTEGRIAVETLDEAGKPFYYATRGSLQEVASPHAIRLSGAMEATDITDFCRVHDIRLIVDAAHPFASLLHANIDVAALAVGIPVVRLERIYPSVSVPTVRCVDFADAARRLEADGITHLLALTGTQTIGKLKSYWANPKHRCTFRILPREESQDIARREGFPAEALVYYDADKPEEELLQTIRPQAIITKESGTSGGFAEKVEAAARLGVAVYVVSRPLLPERFITVTGRHGLRREVEKHVAGFYELRSGYTTGSCATAASKAALLCLLEEAVEEEVSIELPGGEQIRIPVETVERVDAHTARATVVKDGGDDPDVTHGYRIVATVRLDESQPDIRFLPGSGVGIVTLPGLGLPIGGPAINATPRAMMTRELRSLYGGGMEVTIEVPGGEELAKRTFNPKLGIVGGISILGTSGIVRPFSSEAFVNAIRREAEVALAVSPSRLVINSGAKSERSVKSLYPELPAQAFVHYGNFIGETLEIAAQLRFPSVSMGIMLGKAVKLAEGHLDTHSRKVVMNKDFLREIAAESRCEDEVFELIDRLTLARELWDISCPAMRERFMTALLKRCMATCAPLLPAGQLTLFLIDEQGNVALRFD